MKTGERIEAAVTVGTLILAGFTWRLARATSHMADATRQMAVGAEEQLALLRRRTVASPHQGSDRPKLWGRVLVAHSGAIARHSLQEILDIGPFAGTT